MLEVEELIVKTAHGYVRIQPGRPDGDIVLAPAIKFYDEDGELLSAVQGATINGLILSDWDDTRGEWGEYCLEDGSFYRCTE